MKRRTAKRAHKRAAGTARRRHGRGPSNKSKESKVRKLIRLAKSGSNHSSRNPLRAQTRRSRNN